MFLSDGKLVFSLFLILFTFSRFILCLLFLFPIVNNFKSFLFFIEICSNIYYQIINSLFLGAFYR